MSKNNPYIVRGDTIMVLLSDAAQQYAWMLRNFDKNLALSCPTDKREAVKARLDVLSQKGSPYATDLLEREFCAAVFNVEDRDSNIRYFRKLAVSSLAVLGMVTETDPRIHFQVDRFRVPVGNELYRLREQNAVLSRQLEAATGGRMIETTRPVDTNTDVAALQAKIRELEERVVVLHNLKVPKVRDVDKEIKEARLDAIRGIIADWAAFMNPELAKLSDAFTLNEQNPDGEFLYKVLYETAERINEFAEILVHNAHDLQMEIGGVNDEFEEIVKARVANLNQAPAGAPESEAEVQSSEDRSMVTATSKSQ